MLRPYSFSFTLPLRPSHSRLYLTVEESEFIEKAEKRIQFIDLARGIAVTLMILSHGVKGLLSFEMFTSWGLVPIHLITKFSSTLFFFVFGLSLAMIFVPMTETPEWPRRRRRLVMRGLKILFWYKVLTFIEMFQWGNRDQIWATLTYQSFTSFVEILGFYAIAFLWIPWLLPLWRRLPFALKLFVPVLFFALDYFLYHNFDFWGIQQLKAIFVEHQDYYTWGQLARAPLVFVGMLLGDLALRWYKDPRRLSSLALGLAAVSGVLFVAFYSLTSTRLQEVLVSIAQNEGKHPPEFNFMLFSIAGALGLLAIAMAGRNTLPKILKPITIIGEDALQAFIFHICVIFVFYRYLFDYWQKIPYTQALWLTVLLIAMTALWIRIKAWVAKNS